MASHATRLEESFPDMGRGLGRLQRQIMDAFFHTGRRIGMYSDSQKYGLTTSDLEKITGASGNRIRRATDALAQRGEVVICVDPTAGKLLADDTIMPVYARRYFRHSDYHNVHTFVQRRNGERSTAAGRVRSADENDPRCGDPPGASPSPDQFSALGRPSSATVARTKLGGRRSNSPRARGEFAQPVTRNTCHRFTEVLRTRHT